MAKKTVKKQPLKAKAKAAPKMDAKTTKKTSKKAVEPVKAKAAKSAPVVPKKLEKPSKVAKEVAPVSKKVAIEAIVEKTKGKSKAPKNSVVEEVTAVEAAESDSVEVIVAEPEKVAVSKKKSALQKRKEKMEIDSNAKWADLYEKYKQIKPINYSMKDAFEANQPIQHKVLGWGWVISSENDRLEVLFKEGKKILISNYKP
ncbi:MAG: hypothetical protein JNL11_00455 [Bdellovibrionaceae bacterium]|nr:hypothetical protein [Pseudobdellovibrionaceae bacterium]